MSPLAVGWPIAPWVSFHSSPHLIPLKKIRLEGFRERDAPIERHLPPGARAIPVIGEFFSRGRPFAERPKFFDIIAQFHSFRECIHAAGLRKEIKWIGLKQHQSGD